MNIDIDNPLVVFKSDGRMCIMNREKAMNFEEYATKMTWRTVAERTKAKAVWEQAYRQGYKDGQATIKQMENK